jgi:hypothetical protein
MAANIAVVGAVTLLPILFRTNVRGVARQLPPPAAIASTQANVTPRGGPAAQQGTSGPLPPAPIRSDPGPSNLVRSSYEIAAAPEVVVDDPDMQTPEVTLNAIKQRILGDKRRVRIIVKEQRRWFDRLKAANPERVAEIESYHSHAIAADSFPALKAIIQKAAPEINLDALDINDLGDFIECLVMNDEPPPGLPLWVKLVIIGGSASNIAYILDKTRSENEIRRLQDTVKEFEKKKRL